MMSPWSSFSSSRPVFLIASAILRPTGMTFTEAHSAQVSSTLWMTLELNAPQSELFDENATTATGASEALM